MSITLRCRLSVFFFLLYAFSTLIAQSVVLEGYWKSDYEPKVGYYFVAKLNFKGATFSGETTWYLRKKGLLLDAQQMMSKGEKATGKIYNGQLNKNNFMTFLERPATGNTWLSPAQYRVNFSSSGDFFSGTTRPDPGNGRDFKNELIARVTEGDFGEVLKNAGYYPLGVDLTEYRRDRDLQQMFIPTNDLFTRVKNVFKQNSIYEPAAIREFEVVAKELVLRQPYNTSVYIGLGDAFVNVGMKDSLSRAQRMNGYTKAIAYYTDAYKSNTEAKAIYRLASVYYLFATMVGGEDGSSDRQHWEEYHKKAYPLYAYLKRKHAEEFKLEGWDELYEKYPVLKVPDVPVQIYDDFVMVSEELPLPPTPKKRSNPNADNLLLRSERYFDYTPSEDWYPVNIKINTAPKAQQFVKKGLNLDWTSTNYGTVTLRKDARSDEFKGYHRGANLEVKYNNKNSIKMEFRTESDGLFGKVTEYSTARLKRDRSAEMEAKIASLSDLSVLMRYTFNKGKIGEDYIPAITGYRNAGKTYTISSGGKDVTIQEDDMRSYTKQGGYNKSVEGYELIYQLINSSDRNYVMTVAVSGTSQFPNTVKTFWGFSTYTKKTEITEISSTNTFVLEKNGSYKDQTTCGVNIPKDLFIEPISAYEVSDAWIAGLETALTTETDLDIIQKYLRDFVAKGWSGQLREQEKRVKINQKAAFDEKYRQQVSISVKPKDERLFDVDFSSEITVNITNKSPEELNVDYRLPDGTFHITIGAGETKTFTKSIKGYSRDQLKGIIISVRQL